MRTIGLLGGMSWESTAEYYREANLLVRERLGGHHSAPIVMISVDFDHIERLQRAGEWQDAGAILARHAAALEGAGADLVVLCTNTMHRVADHIEAAISVPFLHLADVTAAAVHAAGLTRVGLLGTRFTMEQAFYRDRLATRGLDVRVPPPADRALVHRIIFEELVQGIVREDSRAAFRGVIGRLVADGVEGVILGCTEIELLVGEADADVPLFATTRLHVHAAVEAALRGE